MMKIKASILLLLLCAATMQAQVYEPVDWKFSVEETSDTEADLVFSATIEEGWHVYATELPSDMGPIPTSVTLDESTDFEIISSPKGGKYKTEYDPNFDMDLNYYDNRAEFRMPIKRIARDEFIVSGYLTFMVCNDEMCLPPDDVDISLAVKGAASSSSVSDTNSIAPVNIQSISQTNVLKPVSWDFSIEDENEDGATLVFEAAIAKPWHLYSTNFEIDDDGPMPTEFIFEKMEGYSLDGKPQESDPRTEMDPVFEMEVQFFSNRARFTQKIKKESKDAITANGYVNYMVCDESKCIMEQEEFTIELEPGGGADEQQSYWTVLFLAILGGFAALLTPCVFPMVPMTVSFFTKQSKTKSAGIKNALIYSLSIILVYVVLSVPFHIFESVSPDILNEVSTNAPLNIFFFVVFIVFAISFFGAFEITMPASWVNKADQASDVGGIVGIFFMAIVLVLVSFSCTGPLLGALLGSVLSTDGGASALSVGMLGFGLGLALPFGLFAAFPSWLNSLPKSGGWLNTVKVFLGFLELALAFKFLSNADLVLQAHLLPREIFLAIWIAIFLAMTLYLLGFFRMPHDSKVENLGVGRMLLGVSSLFFTLYLLPGLWGAPLKMILLLHSIVNRLEYSIQIHQVLFPQVKIFQKGQILNIALWV